MAVQFGISQSSHHHHPAPANVQFPVQEIKYRPQESVVKVGRSEWPQARDCFDTTSHHRWARGSGGALSMRRTPWEL